MSDASTQYAARTDSSVEPGQLDVVIVTARGSWTLLEQCLRSLEAHPPVRVPITVHVIDNASRDGTVESTRGAHPEVSVVELPANVGFAAACNIGIRMATGPSVLLLNPDTLICAGAVDRLLEILDAHPATAVVGPRLVGLDGQADHNSKRTFPSVAAAIAHFLPPIAGYLGDRADYHRIDIPDLGSGIVDAVSGSCMLVRREAIAAVGMMDEGYWMYGEDLDWCRRFGAAGWQIRYEGSARVVHIKHGVTGRHRTLRTNWAFHRAMGRFYRRFDAGPRPWLDVAVFAGIVVRFGLSATYSAFARGRRIRS